MAEEDYAWCGGDFDEDLIFDIELEVVPDQNGTERLGEDKQFSTSPKLIQKIAALLKTSAFQEQIAADVARVKSSLGNSSANDSYLPALAAALPSYNGCQLLIREAVGASPSSLTACLSQLRHAFLVLEVSTAGLNQTAPQELIIDPCFADNFVIGHPTTQYEAVLEAIPEVYVGKPENLKLLVSTIAEEIAHSCKTQKMPVPPWRTAKALHSKWLPINVRDYAVDRTGGTSGRLPGHAQPCHAPDTCWPRLRAATSSPFLTAPLNEVQPITTVYGFSPAPMQPCSSPQQAGDSQPQQVSKAQLALALKASSRQSLLTRLRTPVAPVPGDINNKAVHQALSNGRDQAGRCSVPSQHGYAKPAFNHNHHVSATLAGSKATCLGQLEYPRDVKGGRQPLPDHRQFFDTVLLPIRKVKLQGR